MRIFLLLSLLFLLMDFGFGGENFSIDAQIRHRFEMDAKDFNADTKFNNNGYLRSRIGFNFRPIEDVSGYIQLQDSRKFGSEDNTIDGSAEMFDLHQGFFKITNIFDLPFDFQLGRYEASYSNQRLIGALGWSNVGRSFDGFTVSYKSDFANIDLFNFKENEEMLPGDVMDKNIHGIWADLNLSQDFTSEFNLIWQREQGSDMLSRLNLGTNLGAGLGDFKGLLEFNYQTGSINSDVDIAAMMFALNADYKFSQTKYTPYISAGVDYLSGDDDPADDQYKVFNTLYATNHKFYGISDFFLDIPANTFGAGLTDIHLKAGFNPCEQSNVNLAYHVFNASEELNDMTEFGSELDLIANYKYNEVLNIQAGFGLFMPGELFEEIEGEDNSNFGYIMTTFKF